MTTGKIQQLLSRIVILYLDQDKVFYSRTRHVHRSYLFSTSPINVYTLCHVMEYNPNTLQILLSPDPQPVRMQDYGIWLNNCSDFFEDIDINDIFFYPLNQYSTYATTGLCY